MDDRLAELQAEIAGFRRFAVENPDHLHPGLAFALADLSTVLRDLERPGEALEAAREAATLFRILDDHDPQFRHPRAVALNNFSARLQDMGMTAAALEASREAVDVAAALDGGDDDGLILAAARLNMATQLFILGAAQEGAAVLCEVGRAVRRAIEAGDDEGAGTQLQFLQHLADQAHGRAAWAEHVAYRRALSMALPGDPPAGRAVLAYALDEAAANTALDDPAAAATWAEQAVAEFRRLSGDDPARHSAALVQAADRWLRLVHGGDDATTTERAARALASAAAPGSEHSASALTVLAMALDGQARLDEALAASDEALAVWRARPGQRRRLASCLNLRTGLLTRLGRLEEGLDTAAEAVAAWRAAETIDPETDAVIFADTLRLQAGLLVRSHRWAAALAVVEEGTRLILSAIIQAGVGSSSALDEFERLRGECQRALGREG